MLIRKMTMDDYDKVYDLWIHASGVGVNTTDDSREGIAKYLARNPDTCFVAMVGEEIIGVTLAGHDGRRGFIYHTSVRDSEREKGVGRALVQRAMEALEREGISKVGLIAFAANEGGNVFWEKMGFIARQDVVYRNKSIKELEYISAR